MSCVGKKFLKTQKKLSVPSFAWNNLEPLYPSSAKLGDFPTGLPPTGSIAISKVFIVPACRAKQPDKPHILVRDFIKTDNRKASPILSG